MYGRRNSNSELARVWAFSQRYRRFFIEICDRISNELHDASQRGFAFVAEPAQAWKLGA
jgi:hypothetical protein